MFELTNGPLSSEAARFVFGHGFVYDWRVLAEHFVSVMACPVSKQPVIYFPRGEADRDEAEGFILCPSSRLRYRIDADGVPVFLAEEATEIAPADVDKLVARANELGLHVP